VAALGLIHERQHLSARHSLSCHKARYFFCTSQNYSELIVALFVLIMPGKFVEGQKVKKIGEVCRRESGSVVQVGHRNGIPVGQNCGEGESTIHFNKENKEALRSRCQSQ